MTYFLFEDFDESPVSDLLKVLYNPGVVVFSGGNYNLYSTLKKVYSLNDFFVVFVDFIPNNVNILRFYNDFVQRRLLRESNVLVVPILCIEYYVLAMLRDNGILRIRSEWSDLYSLLFEKEDYRFALKMYKLSFEKLYKRLLTGQFQMCAFNNSKHGEYYKNDCKCKLPCKLHVSKKLADKSFSLWRLLPVMDDNIIEDVLPFDSEFRSLSSNKVRLERQSFFKGVFEKLELECPVLYY